MRRCMQQSSHQHSVSAIVINMIICKLGVGAPALLPGQISNETQRTEAPGERRTRTQSILCWVSDTLSLTAV